MSVKRSPQKSTRSHPDLTKTREEPSANITQRKKKIPECHCDHEEILSDFESKIMFVIKTTIEVQNEKLNSTLDALRQDFCDFKQQLVGINTTIKKVSEEQIELKNDMCLMKSSNAKCVSKLETLSNETTDLRTTVTTLTEQLSLREQQGRMNNLEITGIPVTNNENLMNIVQNIATKIGFPLCSSDIDYIHRVRRFNSRNPDEADAHNPSQDPSTIPNIILRFTQRKRKCDMLAAVRARRNLTTADAGLNGSSKPVFINEHLTPQNKLLYKQARILARDKGYTFVWLSDCKIFVRKNETSKVILISNEKDLIKIK